MTTEPTIEDLLRLIDERHSEIAISTDQCAMDAISLPQLVGLAAASRSRELVRTFRFNVENNLEVVAPAIMRLQLDSALRLHALRIVDDSVVLARFILDGNVLKDFSLRTESPAFFSTLTGSNKSLNDSFLYQQLSATYSPKFSKLHEEAPEILAGHSNKDRFLSNPVGDIYQDGNKFVHLSQSHIMGQFEFESLKSGVPVLKKLDSPPNTEHLSATCCDMLFATDVLRQQIEVLFTV